MNSPRTRRPAATLLMLVVAAMAASSARAHAPDPSLSGALWAQNQQLTFRWRSGAEPPAAIKTAIRGAASASNATRASKAATFVYSSSGASPIGYGTGATCGVNGIACFTRTAPDGGFTMWLREHGRVFDWGTLKWCQMYADPPNGCYDAETIALDEFGHIQILAHHLNYSDDRDYLDAVVQTFSRTKPKDGWKMHIYGRCDVATLQLRYDTTNSSAKYSTCLKLDTVLTLSASPTSVAFGGTTTLSSVLKVAGNDSYGRLRGNPVSGRTVTLQRRAPGTTSWTSVGSMATGSTAGTYTMAIKLQATAEFRAVFRTPAGEGLVGSTSTVVKITVGSCTTSCPLSTPTRDQGERR
ncbi:MAG: hypothetical protein WEC14_04395 [Chloroflexota bacterium]